MTWSVSIVSGRKMVQRITAYTGIDVLRNIMPARWQAKSIAKLLLKGDWKDADPATVEMVIELPAGSFKIVDLQGNVEPCDTVKVYP